MVLHGFNRENLEVHHPWCVSSAGIRSPVPTCQARLTQSASADMASNQGRLFVTEHAGLLKGFRIRRLAIMGDGCLPFQSEEWMGEGEWFSRES